MRILDDNKIIKQYQKFQVAKTILLFPKQIVESWVGVLALKLPKNYRRPPNIVISGMGGSNLASELIRSVYGRKIKSPLILVRNYHLPQFVDNRSLVIISSYSGNTEETLNCLQEAIKKKAKIFCLAGGGRLLALAKKHKIPYYQLNKKLNPANQPRYGLGLQLGAFLAIFKKLQVINLSSEEIGQILEYLMVLNESFWPEVESARNLAKNIASELVDCLPVLVAADFLSANTHILANQINESAKNLAAYYPIPELNHHLLEGLKFPLIITAKTKFLFFNCNLYSAKISRCFVITQKILKKQQIKFIDYTICSNNYLATALEILLLGSWTSYYLTILNKQNPLTLPYIDLFKKELAE